MSIYWNYFKTRYLGQKGQGMVEYALIVAFIAVVAAAVLTADGDLGGAIKAGFTKVKAKIGT